MRNANLRKLHDPEEDKDIDAEVPGSKKPDKELIPA